MPDGIESNAPTLEQCALGRLAGILPGFDTGSGQDEPELGWLAALAPYAHSDLPDAPLARLAARFGLTVAEKLAAALCRAVESDPMAGRAIVRIQAPLAGARPTLALAARAFDTTVEALAAGAAVRCGILVCTGDGPLPTRELAIPAPLHCALAGVSLLPDGVRLDFPQLALPNALVDAARAQAHALVTGTALVLRAAAHDDALAVAAVVARTLGAVPVRITNPRLAGLAPWLVAGNHIAVLDAAPAPGETLLLPELAGLPLIVVAGPDGAVASEPGSTRRLAIWNVALPDRAARTALWHAHLGDACGALPLRRMSAAHIDALAAAAAHHARLDGRDLANREDVCRAAAQASGLDGLAQPVDTTLDDSALVLPPTTRAELDAVLTRCQVREGLVDRLGAAARARARLGVAALFTGPSGTGKTLACAWLAQRLALPLWRVDTAAVTSKYIGETEKNLAQILARAESEGVALLFDEADALFGKRTDVRDANDRYANQQTNYLLQRIESFDSVAFLTSNSRSRFDAAFTRRLDAIVDFAAPGPEERRALWLTHLGEAHPLAPAAINQLAANIDLSGGHIRNVVLAAAAAAHPSGRAIALDDLRAALEAEYRKLGRQMPGTANLFKP